MENPKMCLTKRKWALKVNVLGISNVDIVINGRCYIYQRRSAVVKSINVDKSEDRLDLITGYKQIEF